MTGRFCLILAEHLDPVAGPERHVDATQRSKPSPLDGFCDRLGNLLSRPDC